jgi:hypothetical protein
MPVAHQSGEFQDAQVLGDCGLGNAGLVSQGPHGLFAIAGEPLEYRPAGWVSQAGE